MLIGGFCVEVRRDLAFRYLDCNIEKVDGTVRNTGGKFDCGMIVVAMFEEVLEVFSRLVPQDKYVINIPPPAKRQDRSLAKNVCLQTAHK